MNKTRRRQSRSLAVLIWLLAATAPAFGFGFTFGESPPSALLTDLNLSESDMGFLINSLEHRLYNEDLGFSQTRTITQALPTKVKYALYERYQVSPYWGLANVYFVGSLIQGDPGTSALQAGSYLAGVALASGGAAYFQDRPEARIAVGVGVGLAVGGYLYGLVRPWFFADEQNNRLRKTLFGN